MDLFPDFKDLLEEFAREGVECVLVGGYAVAFHGRPRATKDIDLVLRGTDANLSRAATALDRFGAPAVVVQAVSGMSESDIVYLGQPPFRVDLLRTIDGVSVERLFDNAVTASIDGVSVQVIALDDLITNHQDQIDAEFLERVHRKP